jgi:uncharacterized protein YggE
MVGEAKLTFHPNQVVATFLLTSSHRDQAAAKKAEEEKLGKLVAACRAAGVEQRNLIINDVGLQPEYRGNEVTGYVANRAIVLTLTDMARVDEALTAAVRSGGTLAGQVMVMNTEHQAWETKARIAAATSARERAKSVVEAIGAKLGLASGFQDRTPSIETVAAGTFAVLADGSVSSGFATRELAATSSVTVQFDMDAP